MYNIYSHNVSTGKTFKVPFNESTGLSLEKKTIVKLLLQGKFYHVIYVRGDFLEFQQHAFFVLRELNRGFVFEQNSFLYFFPCNRQIKAVILQVQNMNIHFISLFGCYSSVACRYTSYVQATKEELDRWKKKPKLKPEKGVNIKESSRKSLSMTFTAANVYFKRMIIRYFLLLPDILQSERHSGLHLS